MSLYVNGRSILSYPQFIELTRELPEGFSNETLTDLALGVDVDPDELRAALDVSVRLAANSKKADEIINAALDRLAL